MITEFRQPNITNYTTINLIGKQQEEERCVINHVIGINEENWHIADSPLLLYTSKHIGGCCSSRIPLGTGWCVDIQ